MVGSPSTPGVGEGAGEALERGLQQVLVELGPVEVPRQVRRRAARRSASAAASVAKRRSSSLGVAIGASRVGRLEPLQRPVLLAQKRAVQADGVGVVVLVVGAVAEVERALVVDLEEHDRAVRVEQRPERRREELEVARRLVVECLARVARHREREGQHRQHHRVVARRAGLAARIPHDALGDAEVGELGVDVRSRADDGVEPELVREAEEGADVALGIAAPELELSRRDLVYAPRDVGVDQAHAHVARGRQARAPVSRIEPPVMDAAGRERHDLVTDAQAPRRELYAAPRPVASRSFTACPVHVRGAP